MKSAAKTAVVFALLLIPAVHTGCLSRLAKEGLGATLGARGEEFPIRAVGAAPADRPLGAYTSFELGTIEDDYGHTPEAFFTALRRDWSTRLAGSKLAGLSEGETLLVRGKVVHFELSGVFGHAFGPLEEVVARIELVDKSSGRVLGVANCVGRTKESTMVGPAKKAEGLNKAIIGWIESRHPAAAKD